MLPKNAEISPPISFKPGTEVLAHGHPCVIEKHIGPAQVLVRYRQTQDVQAVDVSSLTAPEGARAAPPPPEALSPEDRKTAERRYEILRPVLDAPRGRRSAIIRQQAEANGISRSTIFRWLDAYDPAAQISSLAPQHRAPEEPRLNKKTEALIAAHLEQHFLKRTRPSQTYVIEKIQRACRKSSVDVPHANTIRRRIAAINPRKRLARRHGPKAAQDFYEPAAGTPPDGTLPLETVQIDHTKLDIMVVSKNERVEIGRPWLTLAIDTFSRMVVGFYLSLDHPSALSVGMCVSRAMLPKDDLLARLPENELPDGHALNELWPVWGPIRTLHADNGKDFRSKDIVMSCKQHNINIKWRPVKNPKYGGHIERLIGTFNTWLHNLDGTTKSNIRDKGDYDAGKGACMTLDELEVYLLRKIVCVYHIKKHTKLGMPPLKKWHEGVMSGRGIPDPYPYPKRLRLDFLPHKEHTIQDEGVVWENIWYHSEVFNPYKDAEIPGQKRKKFIVRRDPRDISRVYILLKPVGGDAGKHDEGDYFEVPSNDLIPEGMTTQEFRASKKNLGQLGYTNPPVTVIADHAEEQNERLIENAKREKKAARKKNTAQKSAAKQGERRRRNQSDDAPIRLTRTTSTAGNGNGSAGKTSGKVKQFTVDPEKLKRQMASWNKKE